MKRLIFLATALAAMVIISIGCSDDSVTTNNDLLVGDTNSIEFQFVAEILGDDEFGAAFSSIEMSFDFLDSAGVFQTPGKSEKLKSALGVSGNEEFTYLSLTKTYVNGWHIFSFEGLIVDATINDSVSFSGIDSVQIRNLGEVISVLDSVFDEFYIRSHLTYAQGSASTASSDVSIVLSDIVEDSTGLGMGFTVNATSIQAVSAIEADSEGTCDFDVTSSISMVNVILPAEGCPTGGTVSITSDLSITCIQSFNTSVDTISVSGVWTVTATYNSDNTIDLTFSDGTTIWSFTEDCVDETVQASPFRFRH